jgi:serine protease Do
MTRSQIKTIVLSVFFSALAAGIVSAIVFIGTAGLKDNYLSKYLEALPFKVSAPAPASSTQEAASAPTSTPQIIEKKVYVEKPDRETMIVAAVEAANPAVVSIIATKDVPVYDICYVNPFENDPNFKGFEIQIPQPCQKGTQKQKIGAGSGFIASKNGLIVTNKHVVSDTDAAYSVILADGSKFDAQVLARDPGLDFAVLKINKTNLPVVKLGDSSKIKVGQTVIAIGNALGEYQNTTSIGIVSGLERTITATSGGLSEVLENVIQTDAAINPGNSGGPLLNLNGEVIGINVAMSTTGQSISFALPINSIKTSLAQVEQFGEIRRAMLGVRYALVTAELETKLNLTVDYGAYLTKGPNEEFAVWPGSPAETAGLKEGDIILEIDGVKINEDNPLSKIIPAHRIGDTVTLKVLKSTGETVDIKVTLIKMQ